MKNNIKKAPVKFWEDLLYFQHFMQIFVFAPYHHLKFTTAMATNQHREQEHRKRGKIRTFTRFGTNLRGIPYSPVKWRDNSAKVDKILFGLAILYKSLHIVLGNGGSDETGWNPGLLIFSSLVIFPHRMAFVWGRLMQ